MAKVCIACGLVPPEKAMPIKESEEAEDCPGCGEKGAVRETLDEALKQKEEAKKE